MNSKDLKTISKLSGIKMSEIELSSLEADLERINAMADALAALDLCDARSAVGVSIKELRADEPTAKDECQGLTASAPFSRDGYIKTVSIKGDEV